MKKKSNKLNYKAGITIILVSCLIIFGGIFSATYHGYDDITGPGLRLNVDGKFDCSGAYLGNNIVLTAAHCLNGKISIDNMAVKNDADVLWSNTVFDVALLHSILVDVKPGAIRCNSLRRDELVYTVGNPLGFNEIKTKGVVLTDLLATPDSANQVDHQWAEYVLADLTIAPGNSGGPVFDSADKIVGLVVGWFQGTNFAVLVPNTTICKLLARS